MCKSWQPFPRLLDDPKCKAKTTESDQSLHNGFRSLIQAGIHSHAGAWERENQPLM